MCEWLNKHPRRWLLPFISGHAYNQHLIHWKTWLSNANSLQVPWFKFESKCIYAVGMVWERSLHSAWGHQSFYVTFCSWVSVRSFCSASVVKVTPVRHFRAFCYGSEKNIETPKSSLYSSQVFGLCGLSSSSLGRNSLLRVQRSAWTSKQNANPSEPRATQKQGIALE